MASFLGASQAYVTKWYDQTAGNGNNATCNNATSSSALLKYDTANKRVDFTGMTANSQTGSANAFFNLQNSAFPYGNGDYSFIMKMGTYYSSIYPLYSAGAYGPTTSMTVLANFNGTSGSACLQITVLHQPHIAQVEIHIQHDIGM